MLRIAMISVHTCPLAALGGKETGGMNVYVRELGRELGRRGLIIDVYTRQQSPDAPLVREMGENARVIHVKAGPPSPMGKAATFSHLPEFVNNLRRFVDHHGIRYDLVHSHYWLSGWVGGSLKALWHAPLVHMFHTLGYMKNAVASSVDEREPAERLEVERQIVGVADRLVAATPTDKAQMIWLYGAPPDKIQVVPCGVDLALFHPIPSQVARGRLGLDGKRVVLFVGRIEPLKGIDTLIGAVAVLKKYRGIDSGSVRLLIVGGDVADAQRASAGNEMRRLHELARGLGVDDRVQFLGAQPQDILPYYYSACDVLVMPSYYESFGMVAVEAMASGAPVIASKVGGLPYIVQNGRTGFLVAEGRPDILADRIAFMLENPLARSRFSAEAVKSAKAWSWGNIADQMLTLYWDVLGVCQCQSRRMPEHREETLKDSCT